MREFLKFCAVAAIGVSIVCLLLYKDVNKIEQKSDVQNVTYECKDTRDMERFVFDTKDVYDKNFDYVIFDFCFSVLSSEGVERNICQKQFNTFLKCKEIE